MSQAFLAKFRRQLYTNYPVDVFGGRNLHNKPEEQLELMYLHYQMSIPVVIHDTRGIEMTACTVTENPFASVRKVDGRHKLTSLTLTVLGEQTAQAYDTASMHVELFIPTVDTRTASGYSIGEPGDTWTNRFPLAYVVDFFRQNKDAAVQINALHDPLSNGKTQVLSLDGRVLPFGDDIMTSGIRVASFSSPSETNSVPWDVIHLLVQFGGDDELGNYRPRLREHELWAKLKHDVVSEPRERGRRLAPWQNLCKAADDTHTLAELRDLLRYLPDLVLEPYRTWTTGPEYRRIVANHPDLRITEKRYICANISQEMARIAAEQDAAAVEPSRKRQKATRKTVQTDATCGQDPKRRRIDPWRGQ
jgi:hypothetical protein